MVRRLRGAGAVDRRHHPDARARAVGAHRRRDGGDPQPVAHRPHARRLVGRRGRRGRQRHGAGRARHRRPRLDPHPGGLLRAGRPQARPRRGAPRARRRRLVRPHRARHPGDHRRRRCVDAFAVLAGRRPEKLVPPARLRVRGLDPLAGGRRAGRTRPNRDAVAAAARAARRRRPRHGRRRPGLPHRARAAAHRDLVRGGGHRASSSDGIDPAALQPRTRRHVALGDWALRAGYVREADRESLRDRSIDVLLRPLVRPADHARAGRRAAGRRHLVRPVVAGEHDGQPALRAVRGRVERGRPAGAGRAGRRTPGRAAGGRPAGRPARLGDALLAVAGQLEVAAPWRRHAPSWPRTPEPTG